MQSRSSRWWTNWSICGSSPRCERARRPCGTVRCKISTRRSPRSGAVLTYSIQITLLARRDAREYAAYIRDEQQSPVAARHVMAYTFARVDAVVSLRVEDYAALGRRAVLRLHEKGGKEREQPVHHQLEEYLDRYIAVAGITGKGAPLFRSAMGRTGKLTERPMRRGDAYQMERRRMRDAGIAGNYRCHSFRATSITTFLEAGEALEIAQWIAGHADARTTKLYDKRGQRAALDDLERVRY